MSIDVDIETVFFLLEVSYAASQYKRVYHVITKVYHGVLANSDKAKLLAARCLVKIDLFNLDEYWTMG